MKYAIAATLVSTLALGACSSSDVKEVSDAEAAAHQGEQQVAAASSNDDGRQCRYVSVTGTRMKEKRCTTAAQREAQRRSAQEGVQGFQNRSNQVNMSGN